MANEYEVAILPAGAAEPGGYSDYYNSMQDMETAENGSLIDDGGTLLSVDVIISDGNWNNPDGPVVFDGWTCDYGEGEYIKIDVLTDGSRNPYGAAENYTYSASHYRLEDDAWHTFEGDNATNELSIEATGLQIKFFGTGGKKVCRNTAGGVIGTLKFLKTYFWQTATGANTSNITCRISPFL